MEIKKNKSMRHLVLGWALINGRHEVITTLERHPSEGVYDLVDVSTVYQKVADVLRILQRSLGTVIDNFWQDEEDREDGEDHAA